MKTVQSRKIITYGDSWGVSLNKAIMKRKGFNIGEIVRVTVEPELDENLKEVIFAEVAAKKMRAEKTNLLTIKLVNDETLQDEDNDGQAEENGQSTKK